ncbi:ERCC excision repair 6 like, spindle assembly checkpoint helicase [Phyllostomus discolor]|uniref:DNA excision repair protein ERCC-6-like n=1 Tax=Phyllostomus discolor TaxID=89673 RepID=A0A6J2MJQ4_9CHIR|nr:DNA excision repair protein ERCC-6-like [Phyllostomus discolor]KAF6090351.1 ERCC excision repair 6 like, spindle assembly checkpoint helicase [Phyllostomus discolor]
MEASQGFVESEALSPEQAARYLRYVKEAKEATKNGDLEEAFKLFHLAKDIFPSEKLMSRIQKLQEALEELADHGDDEFTDVCNSGLLLYRELHDQLFEHQKEGVAFLYSLYRDGRKGGILADDMGLGKTVQIIAFLSGMFDASLVNHVLLIMPTSLISTWVKEFDKWTPGMRVKTFHGPSKDERTRNLSRIQQRNGVIITTYQMLINNWQQLSTLNGQEFLWDYVILDEAHKIKSSSTKSAVCARAVPAKNRILLTGTPIQNNLQELWSLFDFACQGSLLGTLKTFKMEYENPITRAREKDATPGEKALGFKISENLMAIIKPYFLRRTKEEVQKRKASNSEVRPCEKNPDVDAIYEMPSLSRKNDLIIWIRLVPLQEEIYRKFVSLDHIKELLMETRSPLAELGVLKKLCDHPRLLSARACHLLNLGAVRFSVQDENEEEDSSDVDHTGEISDDTLMKESGKMIFLMDLLKRLRDEGHQTLVFSQSRQILNIIERLLKNRHFKVLRIDGTITHLMEREKRISLFQQNKDYSVFLLTTQVGGVGLTLTAATRVVIFDPSWNPATDAQAVDRVHRIGQKENVVVYRLITCGTVEEKIYRRQVFKDSLVRQTTGDKKNPFRYFSKQELRELFTIEDFQSSATQLQLQSLHAAQRRSDKKLDEHIAYLYSLGIAGISDHDLLYTRDLSVKEELDELEDSHYIQQRVQKAQFLVEFESQNTELLMERQRTRNEGILLREPVFTSKKREKRPEVNKPQPQPSLLLTTHHTQEEEICSQMASVIIDDLPEESEKHYLSNTKMSVTIGQDGGHPHERTFDADFVALPKECASVEEICTNSLLGMTLQKEASREGPTQEVVQGNTLESFNYLLSEPVRADLGPNLDEQKDDEILHQGNLWPINPITNENQDTESNASVIEITDGDLSASHSALQDAQAKETKLQEEPLASSLQYMCDFNLFLEDSADNGQNLASQSLEHVEKENSLCGSEANSRAEFVHSKAGLSMDLSEEDDESEVVNVKVRSKTRRIVSDGEDEHDTFKDTSSTNPFNTSPLRFLPIKQFDASTPKSGTSPSERFFSPKIANSINKSINSRRSLASRRSLINVVLDHVEDMEEKLETSSEAKVAEDYLEERTEESSGEDSDCTEEEPSRETLSSESKSSCITTPKSGALAQETSPGDPGLLSGGQLVDSPQDKDKAEEAATDYETLVMRGKALKECGKIQEALNCLVKALDIKSADPEVMLMTLSLYKQLNTT